MSSQAISSQTMDSQAMNSQAMVPARPAAAISSPPDASEPAASQAPVPTRGLRGKSLNDDEILVLLKCCADKANVWRSLSKTAYWRSVSVELSVAIGREYSSCSCERTTKKLAKERQLFIEAHGTGRMHINNTKSLDSYIDDYIALQGEIEQRKDLLNQCRESQEDINHRQSLMAGLSTLRSASNNLNQATSSTSVSSSTTASSGRESSSQRFQRIQEQRDMAIITAMGRLVDQVSAEANLNMEIREIREQISSMQASIN